MNIDSPINAAQSNAFQLYLGQVWVKKFRPPEIEFPV